MAVTQFAMGAMKEGLTSLEQALQRSQKLVDQDPDQYEYLRLHAILP